jgi:GTP cyclohydrolase II
MHLSTFSERKCSEIANDSSGSWTCHTLPPARSWTTVRVPLLLASGKCVASTMITFDGLIDKQEHLAILFGKLRDGVPPLVRFHSECLTGDVFGSARCDCGPQLRESLETMARTGGLILYLRQEGRGIGLYNKLKAYQIQDQGYDTFEANRVLLFDDDLRDYAPAAQMLLALGVRTLRLLSNNPQKAYQLTAHGLVIAEQIATGTFATAENLRYLQAKVHRAGHRIKLSQENAK